MSHLRQFKYFLWFFIHYKVPLIGHLRPKLIKIDEQQIITMIPLTRRSKNHLHSMYFGALAVGADLAGGLHAFYHANCLNLDVSLAFKSFQAQFLKRPEADVYFVCDEGLEVKKMLEESTGSGKRINQLITINAYTNYLKNSELIAEFKLELSVKVINPQINQPPT